MSGDVQAVDEFVSPAERQAVLSHLSGVVWTPSLFSERRPDGTYEDVRTELRSSETAHQHAFPDGLLELVSELEHRLSERFAADPDRLEPWQATRYPLGGRLDYHLDAGCWSDDAAGERERTFLLFLTSPDEGGDTDFRALGLRFAAKAGRLLLWRNLFPDGTPDHAMVHASLPLCAGAKVTLITWERERQVRGRDTMRFGRRREIRERA